MDQRSKDLRKLILCALEAARRGHLGSSMSLVEILRVLYDDVMVYDVKKPKDSNRDRLILSKGHGCLALYAILADKKFFNKNELTTFCAFDSRLGGHPELDKLPGVEATTGALGHGLSIGVGISIAIKLKKKKCKTFVIVGDGEINEGSNWEAALSASKNKLENLTLIIDYNKYQSYGKIEEVLSLEPLREKLESFGFETVEVDGHSVNEMKKVFKSLPFKNEKPSAIICHTVKGKGFEFAENNSSWHHKSRMTDDEIQMMYTALEKC